MTHQSTSNANVINWRWLQKPVCSIAISTVALISTFAFAQQDDKIIRHQEGDGPEYTENVPPPIPGWASWDILINPEQPGLGARTTFAEQLVYEIIYNVSSESKEAYAKAEIAAQKLVKLAPYSPASFYNYACVLALQNKIDEALETFSKSIDLGWRNLKHIELDITLNNLRKDSRFEEMLVRIEELTEEERIKPVPIRTDDLREVISDLEKNIPYYLKRYQTPGVTVTIIREGKMVFHRAWGVSDKRTNKSLSSHSMFRVEAPARLLTALLALQLQEHNKWSLDDPLVKWVPSLRFANLPFAKEITLRKALSFTGGIVYNYNANRTALTLDDELNNTLKVNPYRIGNIYTYVPQSYVAIGRAIEKAIELDTTIGTDGGLTNKPYGFFAFGDFAKGSILTPLGMQRTLFSLPNNPKRYPLATGHTEYGTPYRSAIRPFKPSAPIYTNAKDLAKLIEFLLNSNERMYEILGLSPEAIEQLYESELNDENRNYEYGLGVKMIKSDYGRCAELICSYNNQGMGSLMRWYPDSKCGIVVLFNSDTGKEAAKQIAHDALGGI